MAGEDEAVAEVVNEPYVNEMPDPVDTEEDIEDEGEDQADPPIAAESEEAGEAEEEAEPSDSSPEKKTDAFQERINEVTGKFYQEKERGDHFEKLWEDSQKVQEPALEPGRTLESFGYDEAQFAAYHEAQGLIKARAEVAWKSEQQQEQSRQFAFQAKEAAFAEGVGDYYQVAHHSPISPAVAGLLKGSDKGPELAYYLGKNPALADSLSKMSIVDAAGELGRIEVSKLVKPEPSTNKPAAPAPKIKATDKSGIRIKSDSPDSDSLSDDEWLKRERKRVSR